ncbi:FmdB family zinc ribbon protein [Zavarzinella formosa]|uniref:FmdB family zinc ribbon protein n=1 Tax=Zavarzinella formosa TaxID=360055 RepID=UPI0003789C60|nr:zinc ribbon domain-containing protein [Zavarzinella formosa]
MPMYDFECEECGVNFEQLVRRESDIPMVTCPACSSARVAKAISLPAAPVNSAMAMPMGGGGCGVGPRCGKPWCQRTG